MCTRFAFHTFIFAGLTALACHGNLRAAAPPKTISHNYGKLPISFEANRGQTDKNVKFIARGRGYGVFLTGQEAVLALHGRKTTTDVVRMQLSGSNPDTHSEGVDPLPGTANYFTGNDPSKWQTNVPTYSKVQFSGVYPGVDLVYYGNQSQLEFDFVVAPNGDPGSIRLHFAGATKLKLSADGDLAVSARSSEIAFHKPVIYQEIYGRRQPIQGRFTLQSKNSVGFSLGRYNHSEPLIIDPVLVYSTYLGGSINDYAAATAVDRSGNAYVTGSTQSTDFPVTTGAFEPPNPAKRGSSVFVTKLNSTGTALLYSTYLRGSSGDEALAIAVDASGDAFVTGITGSSDFPVTKGAFQTINPAGATYSPFVTKLNPTGSALLYSTYFGGSSGGNSFGITVDGSGDAFVTGNTQSLDFPVTPGAFQTVSSSPAGFVSKLNPTGTSLLYSTLLDAGPFAVAVDGSGNAFVAGGAGAGSPVTAGAFQTTAPDDHPAFIAKLNATGSALLYFTFLGGNGSNGINTSQSGEQIYAIAVDVFGDAYVTGSTTSSSFPVTKGAIQLTNKNPSQTGFVTCLNPMGSALIYSTYLGGNQVDQGSSIAVDASGSAYVTGFTQSPDFPITAGAFQATDPYFSGWSEPFVTQFSPTGSLLYSTYFGGNNDGAGLGIAVDGSGGVYLTGTVAFDNLPVTAGAFQTTDKIIPYTVGNSFDNSTGFVSKFDLAITSAPEFSPPPGKYPGSITVMMTDATPGAAIHYTLNGPNPTLTSPLYTEPIILPTYTVVRAIAFSSDLPPSPISAGAFSPIAQTPTPVISPASGSYSAGQLLTITDAITTATIRYTIDGSTPTAKSIWYNKPFALTQSETIRVIAISTGKASSEVASATYTVP